MKIKLEWYKASGKWYETYEVEIPDNLYLFSKELLSTIHPERSKWEARARDGMFLVMDNVDELIVTTHFFKSLWTPDKFLDRFDKVDNYVKI